MVSKDNQSINNLLKVIKKKGTYNYSETFVIVLKMVFLLFLVFSKLQNQVRGG